VDSEIDAQLPREVSDALRSAGHETLLLRYSAALQWFNRTRAELERANATGQINETAGAGAGIVPARRGAKRRWRRAPQHRPRHERAERVPGAGIVPARRGAKRRWRRA
jgi:hypothetical protein